MSGLKADHDISIDVPAPVPRRCPEVPFSPRDNCLTGLGVAANLGTDHLPKEGAIDIVNGLAEVSVPTLNEWGLIIVSGLLAVAAAFAIRRWVKAA